MDTATRHHHPTLKRKCRVALSPNVCRRPRCIERSEKGSDQDPRGRKSVGRALSSLFPRAWAPWPPRETQGHGVGTGRDDGGAGQVAGDALGRVDGRVGVGAWGKESLRHPSFVSRRSSPGTLVGPRSEDRMPFSGGGVGTRRGGKHTLLLVFLGVVSLSLLSTQYYFFSFFPCPPLRVLPNQITLGSLPLSIPPPPPPPPPTGCL